MNHTYDKSMLAVFANLDFQEQRRLLQITEYWDFYEGDQWRVQREEGESLVTFNYCKAIVDKSVAFLFGKGFKLQPNKEVAEWVKPILDKVFDDNKRDILGVEMGQMGGITGDSFVKVSWEDPDLDADGVAYDEEYPDGKIRIDVMPSGFVLPEYADHDKDKMTKCTIQYVIFVANGFGQLVSQLFKEVITRDKIQVYIDDQLVSEEDNVLREIYVIQIKNIPMAGDSHGQSDLATIVPLQKEYNSKVTDVSDIINYHSAPVTIIKGAKAKNLEKGAKKIWGGLPKDADVFNLELNSDLGASNAFIDKIKTTIHELSNTPEDSLGAKTATSNTSGVALQIKYSPLLEKTWLKRQTYGHGIQDICRLVLKLTREKGSEEDKAKIEAQVKKPKGFEKMYATKVLFPDPLPKDEMIALQVIAQKMNLGLEEPEGALLALGYEGDITEKLAKIKKYQEEQQNMMFDLAGAQSTNVGGVKSQYDATLNEGDATQTGQ